MVGAGVCKQRVRLQSFHSVPVDWLCVLLIALRLCYRLHAPLSPRLWGCFIQLMAAFDRFAYDYVTEIMVCLAMRT